MFSFLNFSNFCFGSKALRFHYEERSDAAIPLEKKRNKMTSDFEFKNLIPNLCAVFIAFFLTGCASGPDENETPKIGADVPQEWATAANTKPVETGWLDAFGDEDLKHLVEAALEKNHDLKIAFARMQSAQAQAKKSGAELAPSVDFLANGEKAQGLRKLSKDERRGLPDSFDGFKVTRTTNVGLSLLASWEVDVWGRVRNAASAGEATFQASEEDYRWARLSLAAQVTKLWFSAIDAKQQYLLARCVEDNAKRARKIVESRYHAGSATVSDLHVVDANVTTTQANAEQARLAYENTVRALEVVLGRYPSGAMAVRDGFSKVLKDVGAGVPSELLERRPDIAGAERRVAAAFKYAASARAAELPRFSLTAEGGTTSTALRDLIDPKHLVWDLAVNMLTPVIDGGRLAAEVEDADAKTKEAVANYGKTALNAFKDVESALDGEAAADVREKRLRTTYEHLDISYQLLQKKFDEGAGDPLALAQTEKQALLAKADWASAVKDRFLNRVDLYLALGGDLGNVRYPEEKNVRGENDSTSPSHHESKDQEEGKSTAWAKK